MRLPTQVLVYPMCREPEGIVVLLLKRIVELGGFWQGVTGACQPGESLAKTAARELFEETGFAAPSIRQVDFSYSFPVPPQFSQLYAPNVSRVDEFVFMVQLEDMPAPRLSYEHDKWQWFSVKDASSLLKWPQNKLALEHCMRAIRDLD